MQKPKSRLFAALTNPVIWPILGGILILADLYFSAIGH